MLQKCLEKLENPNPFLQNQVVEISTQFLQKSQNDTTYHIVNKFAELIKYYENPITTFLHRLSWTFDALAVRQVLLKRIVLSHEKN